MTGKPKPPRESWEALRRDPHSQAIVPPEGDTVEEMVWRAVSGGTGKDFLDWLRATVIEHRTPETAPDSRFRWDEAQRSLVHRIEMMRDRGAEIASVRKKT